jgi:hypothetical protein
MQARSSDDTYPEKEATERREAALKRMLSTPHKPHKSLSKRKRTKKVKNERRKHHENSD